MIPAGLSVYLLVARFSSVVHNDMIMVKGMDINSRIIVLYVYNVRFYGTLRDTDDWLVLHGKRHEFQP